MMRTKTHRPAASAATAVVETAQTVEILVAFIAFTIASMCRVHWSLTLIVDCYNDKSGKTAYTNLIG